MKIFCEDVEIFNDKSVRRQFQRLFHRLSEGQHTLIIDDIDRFLASAFLMLESEVDQQEWEEMVQRGSFASDLENREEEPGARPLGIHASVGRTRGSRTAKCMFALSADEIGEWAEQPLRLLLENDRDFALIVAAARTYGFPAVVDAERKKWLMVDGRGGCGEVLNRLKRRSDRERLFAFVDQDPDPSNGKQSSTSAAIERQCNVEPPVPFHVTKKREIENYVPEAVLALHVYQGMRSSRRRSKKPNVDSLHARLLEWKALSDYAKDMDDLKKRFGAAFMERAVEDLRDAEKCRAEDFKARARTGGVDELDLALQKLAAHL
jgi:hypothetical protein